MFHQNSTIFNPQIKHSMYMCKEDDAADDLNELNSQLFAAARTNELLTSLRLLAHGARPDWQNPERQMNSSLHVAAASNQALQVELLAVYGGNPSLLNDRHQSPEDMASEKNHIQVRDRLAEIRFEVLDRLSFYRYQKKPAHSKGQHYISGDENGHENDSMARLNEQAFQELCADVFDEVSFFTLRVV